MANKLIVHIGMPKTGTSAIQNFLFTNQEKLKEYGYCYPDLVSEMNKAGYNILCREEGWGKNGVALSIFRSWTNHFDINEAYKDAWPIFANILSKHIKKYNVIISDEDLWCQGNIYAILGKLKQICPDMEIVAYLRRQDLEVEACWNQVVKRYGYCTTPFSVAKERWINERVLKYPELLSGFENIVGIEQLKLRVYEKQQLIGNKGDVIEDFFAVLGVNIDTADWEKRVSDNDRLNGSMLNIKLAMNDRLSKEDWFSGVIEEYFMNSIASLQATQAKEAYFSYDERVEVIKKFEADNYLIARKYFGREDGKLFLDEIEDHPLHTDEISNQDIIKVFTSMMLAQEKKIYKVKKEIERCKQKRGEVIIGNRKVTLFGAGERCRKFLSVNSLNIDIIVDNDKDKSGKVFHNYTIRYFHEIFDWNERFVIITCGAHEDIMRQLNSLGLIRYKDYMLDIDI